MRESLTPRRSSPATLQPGGPEIEASGVTPEQEAACQQYQAELLLLVPEQEPPPTPPATQCTNAEAVIKAASRCGGILEKHADGRCIMKLPKPDPELEAAFARHYDAIWPPYLTMKDWRERFASMKPPQS
jgi:hypothetical protein